MPMKKLILTAVASLACLAAFAQGKIGFQTDSLHLVYYGGPGAGTNSGGAVNSDSLAPGLTGLAVDLYMGTSSSQLFLYSSTTFGATAAGPGKWTGASVQANANPTTGAPAILGGTPVFVEVQVRDTSKLAPFIFTGDGAGFLAYGTSAEFNFTLGGSITYPVMWGANGNWAAGTWPMDQYGTGSRGAILMNVAAVPEPASFALAGMGAAALLIFRRRK
jgi:hypothetical protein